MIDLKSPPGFSRSSRGCPSYSRKCTLVVKAMDERDRELLYHANELARNDVVSSLG